MPYGATMPPPNYRLGQTRSMSMRGARSESLDRTIWAAILDIAILMRPRTLAQFAKALNDAGIATRRGKGVWTAPLVQHEFAARGIKAKTLWNRITQPAVRVPRNSPMESAKQWLRRTAEIENQGDWLSATSHSIHKADLVRHPQFGEGQVIKVDGIALFVCRFLNTEYRSFDVICPASELEVFSHHYSRSQRQSLSQQISADLGLSTRP